MVPKHADPSVIKLAQQFKTALTKHRLKVDQVILFGSHTHGQPKSWSDIDICVVSPELTGLSIDDFPKLRQISEPISIDIEPHGLTPEQFTSTENSFVHEIKTHGIVIS